MKLLLIGLYACCAPLAFVGCANKMSAKDPNPTDYVVGGIYEVQRPLVAEKSRIRALLYDPARFPNVKGTPIPKGTRLQVFAIERENRGLFAGTIFWIKARFIGGPISGEVVELAYVSKPKSKTEGVPVVDTNVLRYVSGH